MRALPRIQDYDDSAYNPFTAMKDLGGEGAVRDFYPELARLRALSPVFAGDLRVHFGLHPDLTHPDHRKFWVLDHKQASAILGDRTGWSNAIYLPSLGVYFGESVTVMDDPDHSHYRRLFQKAFMPRMIQHWGEDIIPRKISQLIDAFEARGSAELVNEFTLHFPFHFIHELMALPEEDRDIFHKLAFGQIAIGFDREHGMDAIAKLKDYLTAVVHNRRENPREGDFISMIATAEVDGEHLPDNVVISFFRQLMNAGGDTSYNGFSSVMCALLTHPDQFERVKADRTLVPRAIEEGLRWNSPVVTISRTPKAPVELAGVTINPGDYVGVVLSAANRDPAVFPEPDRFDIDRGSRGHTAFGLGSHICIGQHLARLEMVTAMNVLLDRLPKLRADDRQPAPEVSGFSLRGPQSLFVRFD